MRHVFTSLFLLSLVLACDPGLGPPPLIEPGFGGTVSFAKGTWPSQDSLVNLWIVASQIYPLDSVKIFAGLFSNPPQVYVYPALDRNLPFYVDSVSYAFNLPPARYRYVAVVQRTVNELSARSLRVVGVYHVDGQVNQPRLVEVRDFEFVQDINIQVNFHQLPPQPF